MARNEAGKIYSATYSNVPVYEFNCEGNHVMRRRADDYINATHILKVADYDKPTRTRILEREVQKGIHEKVQGGYGKYQGTWIPLNDGEALARKNNVFEKLQPIFAYVPGDRSPPPAPKHLTAASAKPRVPRASAQSRRQPVYAPVQPDYETIDMGMQDEETPDNITVLSESVYDEYDPSQYTNPRKRRRVEEQMPPGDKEHRLWAEELLDYFMLQDNPHDAIDVAPLPPPGADVDRPIDEKGHTALHWAAAMGDEHVVKSLIRRGASIDAQSKTGETPLMRTVRFTNSFDRGNLARLAGFFMRNVSQQEYFGATVFHYIANTTQRKSKYQCARYYMDCLLDKMLETYRPDEIESILNTQDQNGDTAITIAARNGARKCVRSLIGRHAAVDIPNLAGETADALIVDLNSRRQERISGQRQMSSSPFQAGSHDHNSNLGGAVQPPSMGRNGVDPLLSQSSVNGVSHGPAAPTFQSDPAITLDAHIVPLFQEKSRALASSIDHEIGEKDVELREAERVANMRRIELENLRKQAETLRSEEHEQTKGGAQTDDVLVADLEALEKQCEDLEREEVNLAFNERFRREPGALDSRDERNHIHIRLGLARELLAVQRDRQRLIKSIVQNLSCAGYEDDGQREQYRRLIVGALGVREEDIESLLPEIEAELEESRGLEAIGA